MLLAAGADSVFRRWKPAAMRSKPVKVPNRPHNAAESKVGVDRQIKPALPSSMQRIKEISSAINKLTELLDAEENVPAEVKAHVNGLRTVIQASLSSYRPPLVQAPALWLKRKNKEESPIDFIQREYAPWLGNGLSRPDIRKLDRSLYTALYGWLAKGNKLPDDFDLPTSKSVYAARFEIFGLTSEEVTRRSSDLKEAARVNRLEKRRVRRLAERRAHNRDIA